MKKILPVFLILCTVLVLALNIFAGSVAGERIAVVKKADSAIDMTNIAKDAAFEDASMDIIDTNTSVDTNATAKIYTAWDNNALYFYVDIFDPNLTKYVQKMATDQGQTGKTDAEVISLYRNKVFEGLQPEGDKTIYPWTIPAFEIVIDPTNKALASSGADQMSKQARVGFDGWQMSYIPGEDVNVAYNCYTADRYTSITETTYTTDGKANGYKIKMKFDKAALGLPEGLKDWDMISVHAFFYSVNADGSGIESQWTARDSKIMGSDNWKATHYSFYRLWDPAVNDAKTREDAEKITEATTTTTTRPKISLNITTKATTTKATTTNAPAGDAVVTTTTTTAPAKEGGCGSVIGTGSIVLMAAMAVAPMVLLKKKKED